MLEIQSFLQGRLLLWLPVSFPAHQTPLKSGLFLERKVLGNCIYSWSWHSFLFASPENEYISLDLFMIQARGNGISVHGLHGRWMPLLVHLSLQGNKDICSRFSQSSDRRQKMRCAASRKHAYIFFTPLKPHFYIIKLGFTGVYIIFIYFCSKT